MSVGDRPRGEITTQEMRIFLGATAGPRRVQLRSFKPAPVSSDQAFRVGSNGSAQALYVEVRWVSGPTVIFIGNGNQLNDQNAKRVDLADEHYVGTVLLMGEEIWVRGSDTLAQNPTTIQYGEVQV